MRRRLLVLLASLLLGLGLLEGVVRLRQLRRYGTTVSSYYHLQHDPASGLWIPRPGDRVGPIEVDSLGFRGPEIEQPKPAGRVRVAFLGGSTTFCAEASSFAATWPNLVVEGLRAAAPDLEFDGVNGGGAGYSTTQSLLNLEHRIAPLEPDVIVVYHGTNDLTQDSRRVAATRGLYDPEEDRSSPIGEHWLTYYLVEKNLRQFLRTRHSTGERLQVDPRELSAPFRERLTELLRRARERAPVVAVVTFSTKLRAGEPPEVQREAAGTALFYMPFWDVEGLLAGYAEYNRVVRETARATGTILIEGEDEIPPDDEHFADTVHFRDAGGVLQARRVLEGLLAAPELSALLAARRGR